MRITRPVLRYPGGKYRIAKWIISHFPQHNFYVEPYGGAGSVLMHKAKCQGEIYNDLDGDVVNVFRILRDLKKAKELERLLRLTPFAYEDIKMPMIFAMIQSNELGKLFLGPLQLLAQMEFQEQIVGLGD